jgi:signal transduction histidine kinase
MENSEAIADLSFWMWFSILFVLGLVIFIVVITRLFYQNILRKEQKLNENKLAHQKELLKITILTQEKERNRIAQDIHDGLVSELNIIRLSPKDDEKAINEKLKACIKTVRLISHDLMPPLVAQTPLNDLLQRVLLGLSADIEVKMYERLYTDYDARASTKLQIFRIIQEVTMNSMKHAQATKIEMYLRITKNYIAIKITDNGIGFNTKKSDGLGMKNIMARTQLLNGMHTFKSIPNRLTTFLLKVPLKKQLYGE